jgi:hypothetical protein
MHDLRRSATCSWTGNTGTQLHEQLPGCATKASTRCSRDITAAQPYMRHAPTNIKAIGYFQPRLGPYGGQSTWNARPRCRPYWKAMSETCGAATPKAISRCTTHCVNRAINHSAYHNIGGVPATCTHARIAQKWPSRRAGHSCPSSSSAAMCH